MNYQDMKLIMKLKGVGNEIRLRLNSLPVVRNFFFNFFIVTMHA